MVMGHRGFGMGSSRPCRNLVSPRCKPSFLPSINGGPERIERERERERKEQEDEDEEEEEEEEEEDRE
ncbi:hypothetical protein V1478_009841 [Vespula squamosa]|uniref:Uncharacterized protein n=1 Tax=Vespula squamosa TaxID=30214 RepID=A0ABD2AJR2_VESSQ